jgi:hypothetical protein
MYSHSSKLIVVSTVKLCFSELYNAVDVFDWFCMGISPSKILSIKSDRLSELPTFTINVSRGFWQTTQR